MKDPNFPFLFFIKDRFLSQNKEIPSDRTCAGSHKSVQLWRRPDQVYSTSEEWGTSGSPSRCSGTFTPVLLRSSCVGAALYGQEAGLLALKGQSIQPSVPSEPPSKTCRTFTQNLPGLWVRRSLNSPSTSKIISSLLCHQTSISAAWESRQRGKEEKAIRLLNLGH